MQIGSKLDIDEALRTEFRIVSRMPVAMIFTRACAPSSSTRIIARAGSRAIESVESAAIESYFAPLLEGELDLACKLVPVPHEDCARIKQNGGASRYGGSHSPWRTGEHRRGGESRGLFLVVFMRLLAGLWLSKACAMGRDPAAPGTYV